MDFPPALELFLRISVFFLGASVGSFLNVVIYRVPLGISVDNPRRSFCPSCKYQIPWYCNLPVLSWILLRGKCANCGEKISARYVGVEALTGVLFLVVWVWWGEPGVLPWLVLPYWVLLSLFIVTVFVDIEHYIIPNGVTLGGLVAGLVLSAFLPVMHGEGLWWLGLLWSVVGAAVGYGILWAIVHLGKLAFGRYKRTFDEPTALAVSDEAVPDDALGPDHEGEGPSVRFDEEKYWWEDVFFRKTDRMIVQAEGMELTFSATGEKKALAGPLEFTVWEDRFDVPGEDGVQTYPLGDLRRVDANVTELVIPREAMGFGDVKFMAMVGAFLGWQAVLFTLFAASVIGTMIGLPGRITGRASWATKIPFGPYLVLGATVWLFFGERIVDWYFGLMRP